MAIPPNPIAGFKARFLSGQSGSPTDISNLPPGSVIAPTNPQKLDTNLALTVKNNRVGFDTTLGQQVSLPFTNDRVGFDTTTAQRLAASVRGDRVGFDTTAAQRQSNSQATPANSSFEARLASYGLDFDPYPNPLNVYANYTYHIRWFLTSETEAYNNVNSANPNSDKLTKTVIAESGVTAGFNIVELVTKASCQPNIEKRNMWNLSEFNMVISEPLGLSLFDKIYFSAQEIGVINHNLCPYFIEVWFNGYDEDGNLAAPNLFYNIYRVNIKKVEASATQVGTTYNIQFIADNGKGEINVVATPLSAVSIPCTSLSEFFDKLAVVMNKQQASVNNDGILRTKYKFVYPDIWKNWSMRPSDSDKHVNRTEDMSDFGRPPPNGTVVKIAKGQAIENIVNYAVYLCKDAQDWITGNGGGVAANAGTQADQALIGYVTVYPSSKITGFDPVTRNYITEVTYTLFRSESLKAFTDMRSVQEAQKATTQQEKLRYLVEKKRLVKRYDYIYTGLNTEVISFDIKINMTWAFITPSWSQGNSYYQYAIPALANQDSQDYQHAKGLIPPSLVPLDAAEAQALDKTLRLMSATPISDFRSQTVEQITAAARGAEALANSSLVTFFDQSSGQLALTAAQAKNPLLQQFATRTNNYVNTRRATLATKYVEDTANKLGELKTPPLPLVAVFDTQPTTQNAAQNADQSKTTVIRDSQAFASGTGFVGAVFGNLFDDSTKEFQLIEIEIRGDPWWIPMSNMIQDVIALNLTNNNAAKTAATFAEQNQASLLGGDNCFLLQFRVGVVIDESTGLAVNDSLGADFFNGIYAVIEATNTFSHGKFTQILKARKDTLSQKPIELNPVGASATPIDDYRAPPPAKTFKAGIGRGGQ